MPWCTNLSRWDRDARLFKFDNPFKDLMTKLFLNKLLNENMYTSSLTFFRGIKPSFKQCIKLVNLSSKCWMIVANCSITKYPAHAMRLSFSLLQDPNVDLTDNNLSLAGNGLNVGVSPIRCHRVTIFHLYQFLFTTCTNLMLNGCNFLRLLSPAFGRKFQWPPSAIRR